jgi:hypothetical protein
MDLVEATEDLVDAIENPVVGSQMGTRSNSYE